MILVFVMISVSGSLLRVLGMLTRRNTKEWVRVRVGVRIGLGLGLGLGLGSRLELELELGLE